MVRVLAVARPVVLTSTMAVLELDQVAVWVTSLVLPPSVVAVAVNCCVAADFMNRLVGVIETEATELCDGKNSSQPVNANTRMITSSRVVAYNKRRIIINPLE